jgi:hypothetical protein
MQASSGRCFRVFLGDAPFRKAQLSAGSAVEARYLCPTQTVSILYPPSLTT